MPAQLSLISAQRPAARVTRYVEWAIAMRHWKVFVFAFLFSVTLMSLPFDTAVKSEGRVTITSLVAFSWGASWQGNQ